VLMGNQHLSGRAAVPINDLTRQVQSGLAFGRVAPKKERQDKNRGAGAKDEPGHRANHQRRAAAPIPASPSTNRSVAVRRPRFAC
jgi:hypothetical protein